MPATLPCSRIRLVADAAVTNSLQNAITGEPVQFWRGADVQVEVAIFWDGVIAEDISNIASLVLAIKDPDAKTGSALVVKTITADQFTQEVTAEEWAAGTKQHAVIQLNGTETELDLGNGDSKNFWLVIVAMTSDVPAKAFPVAAGLVTVTESGYDVNSQPSIGGVLNWRQSPTTGKIEILCPDNGYYYGVSVRLINGVPSLVSDDVGEA